MSYTSIREKHEKSHFQSIDLSGFSQLNCKWWKYTYYSRQTVVCTDWPCMSTSYVTECRRLENIKPRRLYCFFGSWLIWCVVKFSLRNQRSPFLKGKCRKSCFLLGALGDVLASKCRRKLTEHYVDSDWTDASCCEYHSVAFHPSFMILWILSWRRLSKLDWNECFKAVLTGEIVFICCYESLFFVTWLKTH